MPELPEAEVARATLAPHVVGRRIEEVVLRMPTRVRRPYKLPRDEDERAVAGFVAGLQGRLIAGVERRGKGLLFVLDDGRALDFNFGLWASVTLRERLPDEGESLDPPVKRLGLALRLSQSRGRRRRATLARLRRHHLLDLRARALRAAARPPAARRPRSRAHADLAR